MNIKNDILPPEEEFDRAVLYIMREIKKESLSVKGDNSINISYENNKNNPSTKDQRRAIVFLKNQEAIKVIRNIYPRGPIQQMQKAMSGKSMKPNGCEVQIISPNFKKIYTQFWKKYHSDSPAVTDKTSVSSSIREFALPFTITEGQTGYLKIGQYGNKIKIGGKTTKPFLLLESLTKPEIGVRKKINQVHKDMYKDEKVDAKSPQAILEKQKEKITNSGIKELQKIKLLQGKLGYQFDGDVMWLEFTYSSSEE